MRKRWYVNCLFVFLFMAVCTVNIGAATPRFNNIVSATLAIRKDGGDVHVVLSVDCLKHGSGVSGLVKLYENGECVEIWSVSDYEKPIYTSFTYEGKSWKTYSATFEGYAYSNNGTAADRLELSAEE